MEDSLIENCESNAAGSKENVEIMEEIEMQVKSESEKCKSPSKNKNHVVHPVSGGASN